MVVSCLCGYVERPLLPKQGPSALSQCLRVGPAIRGVLSCRGRLESRTVEEQVPGSRVANSCLVTALGTFRDQIETQGVS